jgi:hypothetical protein
MAHGDGPDGEAVLKVFVGALQRVDGNQLDLYADIRLSTLPLAARLYMEGLMGTRTYEYQSDYSRRYFGQGRAAGEASALLTVLAARAIDIPADARARITDCQDPAQLDIWINRAATAKTIGDLFD